MLNFLLVTLWVAMSWLVILITTGVALFGANPIALIVFVPFGTLAILTFWIKDI
jgi:hypothetical protein